MGIGCVLLVWAAALAILAVPSVLLLLWLAGRTGGKARRTRVMVWLAIAAPATVVAAVSAFSAYWASCVRRGVDPGIGDSWQVPIAAGYSLRFIDTMEQAFVSPPETRAGAEQVPDVTEVGSNGPYVYGSVRGGAFLVDVGTGAVQRFGDREALLARLSEQGLREAPMEPVKDYYFARRWTRADLVIPMAVGVPGLLVLLSTFVWAWRSPSGTPRPISPETA
jgi:hypothetical protein